MMIANNDSKDIENNDVKKLGSNELGEVDGGGKILDKLKKKLGMDVDNSVHHMMVYACRPRVEDIYREILEREKKKKDGNDDTKK